MMSPPAPTLGTGSWPCSATSSSAEQDFRGCAWINAYGELGAVSSDIAHLAIEHKRGFHHLIGELITDAHLPPTLTAQLKLLINGALAIAGITHTTAPASDARAAACTLIDAAELQQTRLSVSTGIGSTVGGLIWLHQIIVDAGVEPAEPGPPARRTEMPPKQAIRVPVADEHLPGRPMHGQ